jgi:hypothetical protein
MPLELQPITFKEAAAYVRAHHRHHRPQHGWKFGVAVNDGEKVVGVAMAGQPVNTVLDDGWTIEVHRLCTDSTPHVASMLYGAVWRAAKALGYRRAVTYTLIEEAGTSLAAAGWIRGHVSKGHGWNGPKRGRQRGDDHPLGDKQFWYIGRKDHSPKRARFSVPVEDY